MKWTWHYITANLKLYKKNVPFSIKISEKNEPQVISALLSNFFLQENNFLLNRKHTMF